MSLDVSRTHLTVDPRGLDGLRREVRTGDESPETLRAVAKQFESLFAQMLIKSMRATSFGDGLGESEQTEFYRDIFDQQMAVELSEGKGLGLADMLMRQLLQSGDAASGEAPAAAAMTGTAGGAAATTSSNAGSPTGRADFVRELWPHAQAAGRALGVDPATIVSHAALESGWGRSLPRQVDGQSSFNLFGIKAGRGWQGNVAPTRTLEYEGDAAQRTVANFRAYGTLGDGITDYARLLAGSPRYAGALNTGTDVGAFANALQRAGYATDPRYADKLQAVAAQVRDLLGDAPGLKLADHRPISPATRSVT